MRHYEIETKYCAKHVTKRQFLKRMASVRGLRKMRSVNSTDFYFVNRNNCFFRFRAGKRPEITTKLKTTNGNNFIRKEINVLLKKNYDLFTIKELFNIVGFPMNFSIHKECEIFFFDKYNVVFYKITRYNNKPCNRKFIEIELSETVKWKSKNQAWNYLLDLEEQFKDLGTIPNRRIKKSLYEMYVVPPK